MPLLRRLILAVCPMLAAWSAAADCPVAPGRWQGSLTVNLLSMRVDKLTTAISASLGFSLDFDVACDGTVKGTIRAHDNNEFRAIVVEPAPRQDRCKIGMALEFKSGHVGLDADGLPLFKVEVLKRPEHPGCSADLIRLMPGWLTGAGMATYQFGAVGYEKDNGIMAGDRAWNIRRDEIGYFKPNESRADYESGGYIRWVLLRARP